MKRNNIFGKVIVIIFSLVVILPILPLFMWVFTERFTWPSLFPQAFSLRAVNSLIRMNSELMKTFALSILLSLTVAAISVVIGLMTARAISFYEFRLKGVVSFLVMFPFLVPTTVFAMGIQVTLLRMGLAGNVWGVILCHVIYSVPYATRLIEEGTRALSLKLEEQARVLGCSSVKAFFKVSLPNLIPVILSAFTMAYLISFSQYFLTLLIGGGNVNTFAVIMVPYIQGGERNFASIYSLVFMIVTIVIFAGFDRLAKLFLKNAEIEYHR